MEASRSREGSRRWTRERVARALRSWRKRMGDWPTAVDWTPSLAERHGRTWALEEWRAGDYPHASSVRRVYGSWSAALAGVSRRPRGLPYTHRNSARVPLWTREAIIEAVQRWARENGRPPSYQDWSPAMARRRRRSDIADAFYRGDWPDSSVAARRFGGRWNDVLKSSGFRPREPGPAR